MQSSTTFSFKEFITLWRTYLKPHRFRTILLGSLIAMTVGIRLISPQIIRRFLSAVESTVAVQTLFGLAGLFILIAFVEQGFSISTTYLSEDVGWKATNQLRKDLAQHVLQLDLSFHQNHSPGVLVERLDGDVTTLSRFFSEMAFSLLANLLLFTGILVLLAQADWRIGGLVGLIALTVLFLLNIIRKRAEPRWEAVLQANANLYGFLEEYFKGTEDVRSSGATAYVMGGLHKAHQERMGEEYRAVPWLVANLTLPTIALTLATITVFFFGDLLHRQAGLEVSTVYVLYYYIGLLGGPLWQIVNQIQSIQLAGASINRIETLRRTKSKVVDGAQTPLTDEPLLVKFEDVSFCYDSAEKNVISNLNLTIQPGEIVSLLGRTGSGKSTLARLLIRQVDASSGQLCLGNHIDALTDIKEIALSHLRDRVSIVTQEVQLFRATLRDNLTLFDKTITDERLHAIIAEFGLGDWLKKMPNGLDTLLGSDGAGLSEGEAQLVAFLRLFHKNPSLVILDEASSRLDPATEKLIDQATTRLFAGRTGIIIAHRLQTIQHASQVVILDEGAIVESGSREQLMGDSLSRLTEYLNTENTPQPVNG